MKIYRIELRYSLLDEQSKKFYNSTNQGPMCNILGNWIYRENGYPVMSYLQTSMEYMPEPEDDGIKHCNGWHFGFKDLEQLERFFNSDIMKMQRSGFVISTYEVPEDSVQLGRRQLCFIHKDSVLLSYGELRDTLRDHMQNKFKTKTDAIALSTEM